MKKYPVFKGNHNLIVFFFFLFELVSSRKSFYVDPNGKGVQCTQILPCLPSTASGLIGEHKSVVVFFSEGEYDFHDTQFNTFIKYSDITFSGCGSEKNKVIVKHPKMGGIFKFNDDAVSLTFENMSFFFEADEVFIMGKVVDSAFIFKNCLIQGRSFYPINVNLGGEITISVSKSNVVGVSEVFYIHFQEFVRIHVFVANSTLSGVSGDFIVVMPLGDELSVDFDVNVKDSNFYNGSSILTFSAEHLMNVTTMKAEFESLLFVRNKNVVFNYHTHKGVRYSSINVTMKDIYFSEGEGVFLAINLDPPKEHAETFSHENYCVLENITFIDSEILSDFIALSCTRLLLEIVDVSFISNTIFFFPEYPNHFILIEVTDDDSFTSEVSIIGLRVTQNEIVKYYRGIIQFIQSSFKGNLNIIFSNNTFLENCFRQDDSNLQSSLERPFYIVAFEIALFQDYDVSITNNTLSGNLGFTFFDFISRVNINQEFLFKGNTFQGNEYIKKSATTSFIHIYCIHEDSVLLINSYENKWRENDFKSSSLFVINCNCALVNFISCIFARNSVMNNVVSVDSLGYFGEYNTFEENVSSKGTILALYTGEVILINETHYGNQAVEGGCVCFYEYPNKLVISDVVMKNNTAIKGGAILMNFDSLGSGKVNIVLRRLVIVMNTAQIGGAIYIEKTKGILEILPDEESEIFEMIVEDNQALIGGGVYFESSSLILSELEKKMISSSCKNNTCLFDQGSDCYYSSPYYIENSEVISNEITCQLKTYSYELVCVIKNEVDYYDQFYHIIPWSVISFNMLILPTIKYTIVGSNGLFNGTLFQHNPNAYPKIEVDEFRGSLNERLFGKDMLCNFSLYHVDESFSTVQLRFIVYNYWFKVLVSLMAGFFIVILFLFSMLGMYIVLVKVNAKLERKEKEKFGEFGKINLRKKFGVSVESEENTLLINSGSSENIKCKLSNKHFYDGNMQRGKIYYQRNGFKKKHTFYEGEVSPKGVPDGNGTMYYFEGNKKYEGSFKDGIIHGIGESYYSRGGVEYAGFWEEGKLHGLGTKYDFNGNILFKAKYELGDVVQLLSKPNFFPKKVKMDEILNQGNPYPIGEGHFCDVYCAEYKGEKVAAKILKDEIIADFENRRIQIEKMERMLSVWTIFDEDRFPNQNVMKVFGSSSVGTRIGYIMEYCKCDVKEMIAKKSLSQLEKARILLQTASAMSHIHSCAIIHRDLKVFFVTKTSNFLKKWENVMISLLGDVKVGDFDEGVFESAKRKIQNRTLYGTQRYCAPEIIRGDDYTNSVDVFSFAIMMYEIIFNSTDPYRFNEGKCECSNCELRIEKTNNKLFIDHISKCEFFRPSVKDKSFSEEEKPLLGLMIECWNFSPEKRPKFLDITKRIKRFSQSFDIKV